MSTTTRPPAPPAAPSSTSRRAGLTWRQRLHRLDVTLSPYLYVSPFFVLFALVGVFPLAYTVWVSLHRWTMGDDNPEFLGLDNYARLLTDDVFWNTLLNTVLIFLISSGTQVVAALWIASLLDSRIRARTTFRMGVLAPYVTSLVAVGVIFSNLFSDQFGLANTILTFFGADPVSWHRDQLPGYLAIASMVNWRWTGYNALIFLAAMQAVPRDLYESATLDGAGAWNKFRYVTLPMIRPTVIFVVITTTIGGLQLFTEPMQFTPGPGGVNGGPDRQYQTVVMLMFQESFSNLKLGYGAAIAIALLVVILVVAVVNVAISRLIATDTDRPAGRKVGR